jgi:hypothetical protein
MHVNPSGDTGNSTDAHNIRSTRAETLTTAITPLTEEKTTATGGATKHKKQLEHQGTPAAVTPVLMGTPSTEGILTTVETPATAGTPTTARISTSGNQQRWKHL